MQLISGMNLSAYWISTYIFDILKTEIPMIIAIGLMYAYGLDYENVWVLFILFPFGVIPFTYAMSFLFSKENTAQTFTIFLHFIFAGIGGIIVFILKLISSTEKVGDLLNWIFKLIPSFCLTNSIMFASSKDILLMARPDISSNDFAPSNMGGDVAFNIIHFIIWTILIFILEIGLGNCLRKTCRCKSRIIQKKNLELDEDVI